MPKAIHVLMTGGGAPGAPGILKCLRQEKHWKVTLADANGDAIGRHLHPDFVQIPPANAPLFIPTLLELCRREKIGIILPLVTRELPLLAAHKADFASIGVSVLVSPAESISIANDKSRLYQFLEWRGIAVPDYRIVETAEQFSEALHELGFPEVQVCFKPSVSNGSRGFRIVSAQVNELDLLFNYKPQSTYMRKEDALRILSSGSFPELLVSEWLPGEEYSVDCLAREGELIMALPRLRKKMINGISVEGEIVNDAAIIAYCRSVIAALRLHGNIGIQVKRDSRGEPRILEINPRVQGTISACLGAGINLPALAIKQELGWPIAENEKQINWNIRFARYWEELFWK